MIAPSELCDIAVTRAIPHSFGKNLTQWSHQTVGTNGEPQIV
jgi:hypothetical protein